MGIFNGLITAILLFGQTIAFKIYALKGGTKQVSATFMNIVNFGICVLVVIPVALLVGDYNSTYVLYGIVQGALLYLVITFYGMALKEGNASFCNFLMATSMIGPILYGVLALNEPLGVLRIIGLAVFFVAAYLVCFGEKNNDKKVTKSSYIFIIISTLASAMQSIWIKYITKPSPIADSVGLEELLYSLSSAMVVCLVLTVVVALVSKCVTKGKALSMQSDVAGKVNYKWFWICSIILGISTVFGNLAFNVLQRGVDGAMFYPLANGMPMIFAVLSSPLFREKVSKTSISGVMIGVVAVVLLNI